uniref:Tetraspanin-9 n=1 Tax=Cyanistes caeruleus TaxID=156563 RepID=A0A8C0UNE1_CYACU
MGSGSKRQKKINFLSSFQVWSVTFPLVYIQLPQQCGVAAYDHRRKIEELSCIIPLPLEDQLRNTLPVEELQQPVEFKKCNMARGCLCCLKYMMFLFNLIFWLCGCGLLGVGIWLSVSQGNFATFSPSFPSLSAANLVIAIGTVIMVTGFLGCLGAIKENKCLLLSFFIVLLIILLAELILVILFFVYMDKVSESAKKDLKEGMKLYNSENNIGLKNAWNIIQAEMKCCGVNDYTDWYPVLGENIVPDRCCMENSQDCGRNSTESLWKTGCYEKVMSWFDDNKHVLGSIGMCVLIMQILGMAFSMTLFQQIHRTGKKYDA